MSGFSKWGKTHLLSTPMTAQSFLTKCENALFDAYSTAKVSFSPEFYLQFPEFRILELECCKLDEMFLIDVFCPKRDEEYSSAKFRKFLVAYFFKNFGAETDLPNFRREVPEFISYRAFDRIRDVLFGPILVPEEKEFWSRETKDFVFSVLKDDERKDEFKTPRSRDVSRTTASPLHSSASLQKRLDRAVRGPTEKAGRASARCSVWSKDTSESVCLVL